MKERSVYPDIASSALQELPLCHLHLGEGVSRSLQQAGIETIGQLLDLTVKELSRIPGLTIAMHMEISDRLFSPLCEELSGSQSSLAGLRLPEAAYDALVQSGLETLGEVSSMSYVKILALPGLDLRHVDLITNRLAKLASQHSSSADSSHLTASSLASAQGGNEPSPDQERPAAEQDFSQHTDSDTGPCFPTWVGDKTPIAALELSQRAHDALLRAGITTVGQLAAISTQGLAQLHLMDTVSSHQVRARLEEHEEEKPRQAKHPSAVESANLPSLGLSDATQGSLESEGIETLGQLLRLSGEQVLGLQGLALESVREIREKLDSYRAANLRPRPNASEPRNFKTASGLGDRQGSDRNSSEPDTKSVPLLEALGLSTRAYNCLRRAGYRTVAEIASMTEEQLLSVHNVGVGTFQEIKAQLRDYLNSCHQPAKSGRPVLHRKSIDTLNLSQDTGIILAEEGFVTVGWLIYSVQNCELDTKRVGREAMAEIEIALSEYLTDLARRTDPDSLGLEPRVELPVPQHETDLSARRRLMSQDTPIDTLDLSTRIENALWRGSVDTVGELVQRVESGELTKIRNIGQKSVTDIKNALARVQIVPQAEPEPKHETEITQRLVEIPVIPASIIGWQANLLRRQISVGLLHEEARIGQESVSHLLATVDYLDRGEAYETMAAIIGTSFNVCEELEFLLDQIKRDDYITVLLSRYGFEAQTLESIGSSIGVTRERVRQICNKLERDIGTLAEAEFRKKPGDAVGTPPFTRMQSALLIAGDMGLAIAYNSWKKRILFSGLMGSWTSSRYAGIDPVEALISVCNLVAGQQINELTMPPNLEHAINLAISGSPKTRAKVAHIRSTLSKETAKVVNRHARFCGAVHAEWLAQEMGKSRSQTIEILRALGYELVSGSWFAADPGDDEYEITGHDVFHRAVREMFQYCGPLCVEDICSGLRNHASRTRFPVPPPEVMEEILSMSRYSVEDGLWYCVEETEEQLSTGERIVKQCIDAHGPVVHHSQLTEAFINSELSFPSLHATLRRSPIFDRIDRGLYKLRGTSVSHDDIRQAESASDRVSLEPRVEYDKSGNITLTVNLSAVSIGAGAIASQQFPNLSGEWDCFADERHFGMLQATEDGFRHLGEPFEHLDCQPEDRVRLIFNTWDRTVEIERVET